MIDLILSNVLNTTPVVISNNFYPVTCGIVTTVPLVCSKRKERVINQPTRYFLTLTNSKGEFEVNKCTYNASALFGYYVIDNNEGKWCSVER
jgi:hypothetical protein